MVDVCLSYPVRGGFICVDTSQHAYFIAYSNSDKWVAFSPADAQKLIESCGVGERKREEIRETFLALGSLLDTYEIELSSRSTSSNE